MVILVIRVVIMIIIRGNLWKIKCMLLKINEDSYYVVMIKNKIIIVVGFFYL